MKLTASLLLVIVAVASSHAASLVDEAGPLLDQVEKLPVLLQKARGSQSLRDALGVPENAELDKLETKIRTDLGQRIREMLEKFLQKLEQLGDKAAAAIKELLQNLFNEPPTAENAAKMVDVLSALHGQKETVANLLQAGLDVEQTKALTWYSIEERGISDWWETIQSWFQGVGSWISDKYDVFKEWAKEVFNKAIDAAKPIAEQVKDLAIEFLKNNWDTASVILVKQALEFFWPHAGIIGGQVMQQLVNLAKRLGLQGWLDQLGRSLLK